MSNAALRSNRTSIRTSSLFQAKRGFFFFCIMMYDVNHDGLLRSNRDVLIKGKTSLNSLVKMRHDDGLDHGWAILNLETC